MLAHSFTGVAATASGFVATGEPHEAKVGKGPTVVWTSADGRRWERAPAAQGLPVDGGESLLAHGDQVLLSGDQAGGTTQVTARSSDGGRTWQPATPPSATGKARFTTDGSAFYAAVNADYTTVVTRSADGVAWEPAGSYKGSYLEAGELAVAADGMYLLERFGSEDAKLVHSKDGATWTPVGTSKELSGYGTLLFQATGAGVVASADSGVVFDGEPGHLDLRIFTAAPGRAPELADLSGVKGLYYPVTRANVVRSTGALTVAAGQSLGMASAWWSADGGATWQRSTLETPGDLTALAGNAKGWVAAGTAGVFTSRDGKTWQPAPAEVVKADEAAATPETFLLTGYQDAKSAAWLSSDLTSWQQVPLPDDYVEGAAGGGFGFTVTSSCPDKELDADCLWHSPDGRAWKSVAAPPGRAGHRTSISETAVGERSVLVNGARTPKDIYPPGAANKITFYTARSDGPAWTWKVWEGGTSDGVFALGPLRDGWAGWRMLGQELVVTRTTDGTSWNDVTRAPFVQGTSIDSATMAGDTWIGVGHLRTGEEDHPIIWRVPLKN
ncbi:hypothetical protein OIE66_28570 [Nonomuraea sp. NBC_01738]|uniref:hypothetical protein n=1 Tax=Nonomuraea sp. NBC_01738 TaxID=2976003 RepID=UPI002E161DC9|nr:hypothetical protein OIE66_28570 [Nonomuraea sp. NBC_01738]